MLALCALACAAREPGHSLAAPFRASAGEVGGWALLGSAVAMRRAIRLTTARANQTGALCALAPAPFRDWNVSVRLNAYGGIGGAGFRFVFSPGFCALPGAPAGFSVFASTRPADEHFTFSPIFLAPGGGAPAPEHQICALALRSEDSWTAVHVVRRSGTVAVSYEYGAGALGPVPCGAAAIDDLPDYGYFTLMAETAERLTDDHDLLEISVTSLSPATLPSQVNFTKINRRNLDSSYPGRRRRRAERIGEMNYIQRVLNGNGTIAFADALRIVSELLWRARRAVSKGQIERFLNSSIMAKLDEAKEIIGASRENFKNVKEDLDEVKRTLPIQLRAFVRAVNDQNDQVRDEARKYGQLMASSSRKELGFRSVVKEAKLAKKKEPMSFVLLTVCAMEAIVFGIFVLTMSTRRRKKAD
jgi:hypothetical protein